MLIFLGYILISLFFNGNLFWSELFFDHSKVGAIHGEVLAYQWPVEKFYQQLIHFQNPFGVTKEFLYPFGLHLSLVDAGSGFYFTILRPFLSTYQSMAILVALSLIFANIGMYLLLRKLGFEKILSFILGAAYGYMTFLMPRGGHLSYWWIYLFPWFYYFILKFLKENKVNIRVLSTIGASVFFVMTLWSNAYYFIILLISIASILVYFFISKRETLFEQVKKFWRYILLFSATTFIFLIPWLFTIYDQVMFDQIPITRGWGGAIQFSSDLFNYFLPSGYGHYMTKYPILTKPFGLFLKLYSPSARQIFENFTYPGLIIIASFIYLIFIYKKQTKKFKNRINPYLITSLVFLILTLGPFLHVFGHWGLTVDEGIRIVIPLPYILLHYIPFLNNIRVPGRLIVGFIFFAYIVSAYLITYFLKNKTKKFKTLFFIALFLLFIFDHRYYVDMSVLSSKQYPYNIYKTIENDRESSTVMEIPFVIRDGFTYFGDISAFDMIVGETYHHKPVIGGYTGRVSDYKRMYYMKNPLLGYFGRLIGGDLKENPVTNMEDPLVWQNIDLEDSKNSIEFLDIKYVIINSDMKYTATVSSVLKNLGYNKKQIDYNYSLWERDLENKEFLNIDLNNNLSNTLLGFGWYDIENDFRWADRRSSGMFKLQNPRDFILNFKANSFYKDNLVAIYANKKKVSKVLISANKNKSYEVLINKDDLNKGINTFYFIFDKVYYPKNVISGSMDERKISAKFYNIFLKEK